MNFQLPKIYPITDTAVSGISHAEQVKRLIAGGARMIQLRDKNASSRDFYRASMQALAIASDAGCSIIINDRVDIAYATGAAGVHLGQDDMPAAAARELLGENFVIGLSTHSAEEVRAALLAPIDYIAIGPIFETRTKQQHFPAVGTVGIEKARADVRSMPLVAIGGIGVKSLKRIFAAGADSVAVINGILNCPEGITKQMELFNGEILKA